MNKYDGKYKIIILIATLWSLKMNELIIYLFITYVLIPVELIQTDLPVIIWWSDMLYPHSEKLSEIKCSTGSCVSSKRRKFRSRNISAAYIFYGTDFYGDNLPLPKENNHVWALLHEESPMNNFIFSHSVGIRLFNYTSTFSRNSDFPLTTQFIPSIEYLTSRKPVPIEGKNKHRKSGTAPVLYLNSHCNVASDRDRYVEHLMRFIDIDSYGVCLHNKDLPSHLVSTDTHNDEELFSFISKYKFHIAFENALCDDYITEKLFRALHVGSVPIYKGSPTVKDWVPSEESIIVADDFEDPADLANFLLKLDLNDRLYEQYLKYKVEGISNELLKDTLRQRKWVVNDPDELDFIRAFECYVCDQIQEKSTKGLVAKTNKNCPQPHPSIKLDEPMPFQDEWMKEDWVESYWFAYDQARAIELMIKNKENSSSNFMHYVARFKFKN